MNLYNNDGRKYARSKSKCSYCRAEGHNATQCPRVAEDYAYFTQSPPVVPIGVSTTPNTCRWYSQPKYWGEWYSKCMDAYAKQEKAIQRAKNPRKRSASKCGFCGQTGHNRKQCEAMKGFNERAIKANQNWRRAFYDKFVQEMGLSEGALVQVSSRRYGTDDETHVGIVTSINWDELSLFCSTTPEEKFHYYRNEDYKQVLKITIQIGDESTTMTFGDAGLSEQSTGRNVVRFSQPSWKSVTFDSVLSRSETPLDEQWVNQGHAEAMEFLTKKRSLEQLKASSIDTLIDLWIS